MLLFFGCQVFERAAAAAWLNSAFSSKTLAFNSVARHTRKLNVMDFSHE
jgi:hypothetical protein